MFEIKQMKSFIDSVGSFSQPRTQALPSSEGEAPGYEAAFQNFNCVKIQ